MYSTAQLHVVKDNLACAYGLKDTSGNWFLPPVYINIEEGEYGGFTVLTDAGWGYFSEEGKQVLPFQYDYVARRYYYLETRKNGKTGARSLTGAPILAEEYNVIRGGTNTTEGFLAYNYGEYGDSVYTTMVDYDGRIYFSHLPGHNDGFYPSGYGLLTDYTDRNNILNGIIDTNGHIVIPMIYGTIRIEEGFFVAQLTNKQFTVLDTAGNVVLPPVSTLDRLSNYVPDYHLTYIFSRDSLFGITDDHYKEIVPAIYDEIRPTGNYFSQGAGFQCKVVKDGKTGFINGRGEITVPIEYDTLILVYQPDVSYGQSTPDWRFIYGKDGGYGLLDQSGKEISKPVYELIGPKYYDDHKYLSKEKDLFVITNTENICQLEFLFQKDKLSFYRNRNEIVCIQLTASGKQVIQPAVNTAGNLILLKTDALTRIFDLKGNELFPGKIGSAYRDDFQLVQLTTRGGHYGFLDSQTGKLLIDTLYTHSYTDDHLKVIYAQTEKDGWFLFDSLACPLNTSGFDTIPTFYNQQLPRFAPAISKGKAGIVDKRYQWVVPPIYEKTASLSDDHFLVVTKGGHLGLINSENKLVADTIYTYFEPVFRNYYPRMNGDDTVFPKEKMEDWWLFRSGDKQVLVSGKEELIESHTASDRQAAAIDSLLYAFALKGKDFYYPEGMEQSNYNLLLPDWNQNVHREAFRILLPEAEKERFNQLAYRQELYDLLRNTYEQSTPSFSRYACVESGVRISAIAFPDTLHLKSIWHFGPGYVSLATDVLPVTGLNYGYGTSRLPYTFAYASYGSFESYIYESGRLRKIKLEEIFGTGGALQEELLLAISKRDDLELDCSSPERFVQLINGRFTLSENGVILRFEPTDWDLRDVELLVPNERLKARPETQWIVPYLVK